MYHFLKSLILFTFLQSVSDLGESFEIYVTSSNIYLIRIFSVMVVYYFRPSLRDINYQFDVLKLITLGLIMLKIFSFYVISKNYDKSEWQSKQSCSFFSLAPIGAIILMLLLERMNPLLNLEILMSLIFFMGLFLKLECTSLKEIFNGKNIFWWLNYSLDLLIDYLSVYNAIDGFPSILWVEITEIILSYLFFSLMIQRDPQTVVVKTTTNQYLQYLFLNSLILFIEQNKSLGVTTMIYAYLGELVYYWFVKLLQYDLLQIKSF